MLVPRENTPKRLRLVFESGQPESARRQERSGDCPRRRNLIPLCDSGFVGMEQKLVSFDFLRANHSEYRIPFSPFDTSAKVRLISRFDSTLHSALQFAEPNQHFKSHVAQSTRILIPIHPSRWSLRAGGRLRIFFLSNDLS